MVCSRTVQKAQHTFKVKFNTKSKHQTLYAYLIFYLSWHCGSLRTSELSSKRPVNHDICQRWFISNRIHLVTWVSEIISVQVLLTVFRNNTNNSNFVLWLAYLTMHWLMHAGRKSRLFLKRAGLPVYRCYLVVASLSVCPLFPSGCESSSGS